MNTAPAVLAADEPKFYQPILLGGAIAGSLDLTGAMVTAWLRTGTTPVQLLQFVASGLLGPAAFSGGAKTAAVGAVSHYFIATTVTAVYFLASRKIKFLTAQPVVAGLLYGIAVYLFMNFVVLPFSRVTRGHPTLTGRLIGMLVIMFCIGLPIALIVRRFSK
ncbi:MAG TPA: hypothetical protein VKB46_01770 [Pyrinomonadaceae bacterium]|nr:hypothetical protein [Pyrinomonadaceae bacterium]